MSGNLLRRDSAFARLVRELTSDYSRVIVALFAAYILWFFIGRKIEKDDEFDLTIEVVGPEQSAPARGLIIRVPSQLIVESVSPRTVNIKILGTKEDLDRLRSQVFGTWTVPTDFLGGEPRTKRVIDIGKTFSFTGFRSLTSLRVEEGEMITVTVAQRGTTKVVLTPETVKLDGQDIPEDAVFSFRPSSVNVSGAIDAIERIRTARAKLVISLTKSELQLALREPFSVAGAALQLSDDSQAMTRVTFSDPRTVDLRLERKLPPRIIRLENVPVGWLNVKSVWREGVDPEDPVAIAKPTMWVEVSVPNDYATVGPIEDELRQRLNLFVDMREMPFAVEAQQLPVHFEGLPLGSTIKLESERIDVEWRRKEPPKTENGNE